MPAVAPGVRPQQVPGLTIRALATELGVEAVGAGAGFDTVLTGITLRAQDARPGDLFAALPGGRAHGARFAGDAAARGALAVLTDSAGAELLAESGVPALPLLVVDDPRATLGRLAAAIYGDPSRRLEVVGVTGTSGKTTTCYLLEAALAAGGDRTGLLGTVQTRIAGEALPSSLTTPEAPDLQALFAVMAEQAVTAVAMEVSSHALTLGRVAGTVFAVAAFTNLSHDHLDFHHDMEQYFAAKSLLFDGRAARAVIGIDDEYGTRLAAAHPEALTVSATGRPATWSVRSVSTEASGRQRVRLDRARDGGPAREFAVELALPGRFNAANAAIALACIDALGRDLEPAAAALAHVVVPGRMEPVDEGQDFLAVVDYAHKPAALVAVLDALRAEVAGRVIVVVGAGGDRDVEKRPVMGAEAARRADLVIVTDDNPRSEPAAEIRAAILRGARGNAFSDAGAGDLSAEDSSAGDAVGAELGSALGATSEQNPRSAGVLFHSTGATVPRTPEVLEIGDRADAIRAAVSAAQPGDAVVIAGKGHEQGQDVDGVVHPFSDRTELAAALRLRQALLAHVAAR